MRRREFIALVGGAGTASIAWQLALSAQRPAPVVGFLSGGSPTPWAHAVAAFVQSLNGAGFVDGQNIAIEYRWAEADYRRLPELAADLVRRRPAAIAALSLPAALAAKAATSTIPIVFTTGGDPVQFGLVASLNRPGGNMTGVALFFVSLWAKRLELMLELVPGASVVALLLNPNNRRAALETKEVQAIAHALGKQALILQARNEREIDQAFATLGQRRAAVLLVAAEPLFITQREQLAALAARYAVPAIYEIREFAASGGLMSYGESFAEAYRQVGIHVGRILKGARPADLPVLQPTTLEFVVNLSAARALGLTIPPKLLALADEVIE